MSNITHFPRQVRPISDPLGFYVRPEYRDQRALLEFFASGDAAISGVVFNPTYLAKHGELLEHVIDRRIEAILDTKTAEASTPGGYTEKLGNLTWGKKRQLTEDDFLGKNGKNLVNTISSFSSNNGFTQVIAPTHYINSAISPWLAIDIKNASELRNQLARTSIRKIALIYSLCIPYSLLRNDVERAMLIEKIKNVSADLLWLRIDNLGSDATAAKTCNYIKAASDFHSLGIPVIADQIGGTPGLALLAFGAVGGLSHGITLRERFSASHWHKEKKGEGRIPPRKIYVPELDLMMDAKQAGKLLEEKPRLRSLFGCSDKKCCPRGVVDTINNPVRHFLYQRARQIGTLDNIPETLRPSNYLNKILAPVTNRVVKATNLDVGDVDLTKKLQNHRQRLDSIRTALGDRIENNPPISYSLHPVTRAAREAKG